MGKLLVMNHAILSAIGIDRPGLVEEVSRFIFDRGGNIEDSRMVNLRGQFAMMVLVGAQASVLEKIGRELGELSDQSGIHAQWRLAEPMAASAGAVAARPYRLRASAMDQPGLVHRVSQLLRDLNVNIESLQTQLGAAPITGAPVFAMELVLAIGPTVGVGRLREAIGKLCDQYNMDWELQGM
jgi:glycine cleavage system transcriptional repressor